MTRPVVAEVVGRHIVYASPHFYLIPVMVLYLAATCVSCFFSSHGYVKLFWGVGVVVLHRSVPRSCDGLGLDLVLLRGHLESSLIYFHLRFRDLGGFPKETGLPLAIARAAP